MSDFASYALLRVTTACLSLMYNQVKHPHLGLKGVIMAVFLRTVHDKALHKPNFQPLLPIPSPI